MIAIIAVVLFFGVVGGVAVWDFNRKMKRLEKGEEQK